MLTFSRETAGADSAIGVLTQLPSNQWGMATRMTAANRETMMKAPVELSHFPRDRPRQATSISTHPTARLTTTIAGLLAARLETSGLAA